jgi:DNA-binding beta-propeller fold protein YncE
VRLVRPSLILAVLVVVVVAMAPSLGAAGAAGGGLRFVECLSGMRAERLGGGGCRLTRGVTPAGEGTGVDYLAGLVASPDGRSLYAASARDDAVSAFSARPLRLEQCFTTNQHLGGRKPPCTLLPHPGTGDVHSGFNGVHYVAVSPDGRNVYTVAADGSIATFARGASGGLRYVGCITGDRGKYGSAANGACEPIPSATDSLGKGTFSGLGDPRSLAISPDGRFAYVALGAESAIATMAREADGSLRLLGCLRGTLHLEVAGATSPCAPVAPEAHNPNASGLSSPTRMVISADGTSLYAVSARGASIAEFRRDPLSGALTFSGCLAAADRGTGPGDPCRYVPQANDIGVVTGMYEMSEIAINPDGTALYGVSNFDSAVTAFARDPATGRLSFASCFSTESDLGKEFGVRDPCTKVPSESPRGWGSGLSEPRGLAVAPDGRSLYVGSRDDEAIARFRLTRGGGLHLAGCLAAANSEVRRCGHAHAPGGKPQVLGFQGFDSLVVAGHDLYAAGDRGSALTRFAIR